MRYSTTVGVDLAKNVKPALIAFESCATAHYWARAAQRYGHAARIIPAKAVAPFRQGHKTDSNDALAVAEAARRPNIKDAPMKTIEQQALQVVHRSRERLIQECTALSNHLRGLLMEFGMVIPKGFASLLRAIPEILEDGENELPDLYRPTLHRMYNRLLELREDIAAMTRQVERLAQDHPVCSKLMALEGIGPIGALLL
jgi:transposase